MEDFADLMLKVIASAEKPARKRVRRRRGFRKGTIRKGTTKALKARVAKKIAEREAKRLNAVQEREAKRTARLSKPSKKIIKPPKQLHLVNVQLQHMKKFSGPFFKKKGAAKFYSPEKD